MIKKIFARFAFFLLVFAVAAVSGAGAASAAYQTSKYSLDLETDALKRIAYSGMAPDVVQSVKRIGGNSVQVMFSTPVEAIYNGADNNVSDFPEAIKNNFRLSDASNSVSRVEIARHGYPNERIVFYSVDVFFNKQVSDNATLTYTYNASSAAFGVPGSANIVNNFSKAVETGLPTLTSIAVSNSSTNGNGLAVDATACAFALTGASAAITVVPSPANATCTFSYNSSSQTGTSYAANFPTGVSAVFVTVASGGKSAVYTVYLARDGDSMAIESVLVQSLNEDGTTYGDAKTRTIASGVRQVHLAAVADYSESVRFKPVTNSLVNTVSLEYAYTLKDGVGYGDMTPLTAGGDGYYTIPLQTGQTRIAVDLADSSGAATQYTFFISRSDETAVLQDLKLYGIVYTHTTSRTIYEIPFDKAFDPAPKVETQGYYYLSTPNFTGNIGDRDSFYFEAVTDDDNILYCTDEKNAAVEFKDEGGVRRFYFECAIGETKEYGIYMVRESDRANHTRSGVQYKVTVSMTEYEPLLESFIVTDASTGEAIETDFDPRNDEIVVSTPHGTTAVNITAGVSGNGKYYGPNNYRSTHDYLKLSKLPGFTMYANGVTEGTVAVDRYTPTEIFLGVEQIKNRTGKAYKITVKNSLKALQKVYFNLKREEMDEAKNQGSLVTGLNGTYQLDLDLAGGWVGTNYISNIFKRSGWTNGDGLASSPEYELTFPFTWYPPDAEDIAELELFHGEFSLEVRDYDTEKGEGTIYMKRIDRGRIVSDTDDGMHLQYHDGRLVWAEVRGQPRGEILYDIVAPPSEKIAIRYSTRDPQGVVDKYFDELLPILSPVFGYTGSSPLVVQVGQLVKVPCRPLIRNYGQFVDYRDSGLAQWTSAWSEYGPTTVLDAMKEGDRGYYNRANAIIYYPGDEMDFYLDGSKDPRVARGEAAAKAVYAAAGDYFTIGSGKGYDMMPEARIVCNKHLPLDVGYVYITGKSRKTGETATMRIGTIDIGGAKHSDSLSGSALVVKPKALYFSRSIGSGGSGGDTIYMGAFTSLHMLNVSLTNPSSLVAGTFMVASMAAGIMMGMEIVLDIVRDLIINDGSIYVTWKNLQVKYPAVWGMKKKTWAIDFVPAGNPATDGVTWALVNNSVNLKSSGAIDLFALNSSLEKSSGQSYPAIVGVFPRDGTATPESNASFFYSFPEFLPLAGYNPDSARGLYGPFQLTAVGTTLNDNIVLTNRVGFFCTTPQKTSSGSSVRSAKSAASAGVAAAPSRISGAMLSRGRDDENANSIVMSDLKFTRDYSSSVGVIDTRASAKMALSVSDTAAARAAGDAAVEYVVPTIMHADNIVVYDSDGNEIPQGGWSALRPPTVVLPEDETAAAAVRARRSGRSAASNPNVFVLEFDVPEAMVNNVEVANFLIKYEGDSTLYSVAPEGDGPNKGFRIDAAEPYIVDEGTGGSGAGCSTGSAVAAAIALAALCAARLKRV